ncbi:PRC-barrel domain-containing protein [Trujillonella humicola]|uniref:PRC-barrel domain-containing protein n=1 Tax=Trujillonella humicola TaxID=3383699 RepID=UPI003906C4D2
MLSEREVSAAIGSPAYGPDGEKIGTVEHFYVDDRTGAPTWAAVTTGLFGTRHSVVPAVDAAYVDGGLRLHVTKDAVRSAPHLTGDHLDPSDEAELRRHYGLDTALPATPDAAAPTEPGRTGEVEPPAAQPPAAAVAPPPVPGSAAPPGPPPASDGGMVRSEEQLRVGTERVASTRARLVKYVVTEEVQVTVPIRREEIRIEEVPLDAPDPGPGESLVAPGAAEPRDPAHPTTSPIPVVSGDLPEEVVLHAERPVVSVEVVPVERVRLRTDVVTGSEQITEQVQRERIVVDESGSPARS